MKRNPLIITLILIVGFSTGLLAQTAEPKAAESAEKRTSDSLLFKKDTEKKEDQLSGMDSVALINFFLALSFVLALIFLSTYFFKRFTGIKTPGIGKSNIKMDIVSSLSLGEKRFLLIVLIGGKHYLLGVTPSSINMLSDIELDPDQLQATETDEDSFTTILEKAKRMFKAKK